MSANASSKPKKAVKKPPVTVVSSPPQPSPSHISTPQLSEDEGGPVIVKAPKRLTAPTRPTAAKKKSIDLIGESDSEDLSTKLAKRSGAGAKDTDTKKEKAKGKVAEKKSTSSIASKPKNNKDKVKAKPANSRPDEEEEVFDLDAVSNTSDSDLELPGERGQAKPKPRPKPTETVEKPKQKERAASKVAADVEENEPGKIGTTRKDDNNVKKAASKPAGAKTAAEVESGEAAKPKKRTINLFGAHVNALKTSGLNPFGPWGVSTFFSPPIVPIRTHTLVTGIGRQHLQHPQSTIVPGEGKRNCTKGQV